jgi:hypothetical protein
VIVFGEYMRRNAKYFALAAAVAALIGIGIYMNSGDSQHQNTPTYANGNDQKKNIPQPLPAPQPQDTNHTVPQQPQQQNAPNNLVQQHQDPDTHQQPVNPVDTLPKNDSLNNLVQTPVQQPDAQLAFTQALASADFRKEVIDYVASDSDDLTALVESLQKNSPGK